MDVERVSVAGSSGVSANGAKERFFVSIFGDEYTRKQELSNTLAKKDDYLKSLNLKNYLLSGRVASSDEDLGFVADTPLPCPGFMKTVLPSRSSHYKFKRFGLHSKKKTSDAYFFQMEDAKYNSKYTVLSFTDMIALQGTNILNVHLLKKGEQRSEATARIIKHFAATEDNLFESLLNGPVQTTRNSSFLTLPSTAGAAVEEAGGDESMRVETPTSQTAESAISENFLPASAAVAAPPKEDKWPKGLSPTKFFQYCYKYNKHVMARKNIEDFKMCKLKKFKVKHHFNVNFVPSQYQCFHQLRFERILQAVKEKNLSENDFEKETFTEYVKKSSPICQSPLTLYSSNGRVTHSEPQFENKEGTLAPPGSIGNEGPVAVNRVENFEQGVEQEGGSPQSAVSGSSDFENVDFQVRSLETDDTRDYESCYTSAESMKKVQTASLAKEEPVCSSRTRHFCQSNSSSFEEIASNILVIGGDLDVQSCSRSSSQSSKLTNIENYIDVIVYQ